MILEWSLNLLFVSFSSLFDGSLSSCQAELQELMRQIDIMVNNKRLEWEASIKSTEAQLRQREEEMTTMKMALDLKTAEVGILNLIFFLFRPQGPKLCKFHVISWNFVIFMLDFFMFMSCFVNFMLFHEI